MKRINFLALALIKTLVILSLVQASPVPETGHLISIAGNNDHRGHYTMPKCLNPRNCHTGAVDERKSHVNICPYGCLERSDCPPGCIPEKASKTSASASERSIGSKDDKDTFLIIRGEERDPHGEDIRPFFCPYDCKRRMNCAPGCGFPSHQPNSKRGNGLSNGDISMATVQGEESLQRRAKQRALPSCADYCHDSVARRLAPKGCQHCVMNLRRDEVSEGDLEARQVQEGQASSVVEIRQVEERVIANDESTLQQRSLTKRDVLELMEDGREHHIKLPGDDGRGIVPREEARQVNVMASRAQGEGAALDILLDRRDDDIAPIKCPKVCSKPRYAIRKGLCGDCIHDKRHAVLTKRDSQEEDGSWLPCCSNRRVCPPGITCEREQEHIEDVSLLLVGRHGTSKSREEGSKDRLATSTDPSCKYGPCSIWKV